MIAQLLFVSTDPKDVSMRLIRATGLGLMISLALAGCVPPSVTRTPAEVSAEESAAARTPGSDRTDSSSRS